MRGAFIAFEGVDGSGKTTQARLLADKLKASGISVYHTMEPTDGPIGKLLRQYLAGTLRSDESTLSALFAADRLDHVLNPVNGIKNMLDKGINVFTDRFYISSIAYQSTSVPLEWVIAVNSYCMQLCKPDAHVFLDVSPDASLERIRQRRGVRDIYETPEYIDMVRIKYLEAFEMLGDSENIIVIDANESADVVFERVYESVRHLF